jgi:hypothetical protein
MRVAGDDAARARWMRARVRSVGSPRRQPLQPCRRSGARCSCQLEAVEELSAHHLHPSITHREGAARGSVCALHAAYCVRATKARDRDVSQKGRFSGRLVPPVCRLDATRAADIVHPRRFPCDHTHTWES